ncbi:MAG: AAA family ATPase [Pyrinomonadaceae bacterium]
MSDGEKQVFSLLADIVVLGEDGRLVIADEPELNLNPGLADKLWDLIEEELTDSVFISGTHCVSFAMRANVEKIYVLNNSNIAEIKNVKDIDEKELPALLGSIPAILASNRAIAIEGRENSIDSIIYRWVLGDKTVEIVAVGGCEEVFAVSNKTGVWDALAPTVRISGVIDRDSRAAIDLSILEDNKVTVLNYHEIESYLCHPKIVKGIAESIATMERPPTGAEVEDKIIELLFKKNLIQIAARRVFARGTLHLGLSIEKKLVKGISDPATLESALVTAAGNETAKALSALGEERVGEITKEEFDKSQQALAGRSIEDILKLMPGKNLLRELVPMAGCKNSLAMARGREAPEQTRLSTSS